MITINKLVKIGFLYRLLQKSFEMIGFQNNISQQDSNPRPIFNTTILTNVLTNCATQATGLYRCYIAHYRSLQCT